MKWGIDCGIIAYSVLKECKVAIVKFLFVLLLSLPLAYIALRLVVNLADKIIKGSKTGENNRK